MCVQGGSNLKQKQQKLQGGPEGQVEGESAEEELKGDHSKAESEVITQRVG